MQNFVEMRDKTASRLFRAKKKLDHTLEVGSRVYPLYAMVTLPRGCVRAADVRGARTMVYAVLGGLAILILLLLARLLAG